MPNTWKIWGSGWRNRNYICVKCTHLGVIFDSGMNMEQQVKQAAKTYQELLDQECYKIFDWWASNISPGLLQWFACRPPTKKTTLKVLQHVQQAAARIETKTPRHILLDQECYKIFDWWASNISPGLLQLFASRPPTKKNNHWMFYSVFNRLQHELRLKHLATYILHQCWKSCTGCQWNAMCSSRS